MEIKLTPEESRKYFHNALCNGINYIESSYGLELKWKKEDYRKAQAILHDGIGWNKIEGQKSQDVCHEDVLIQILELEGTLTLVDHENGEEPRTITLKDVHERVAQTPFRYLSDMIEENDDAITADVILQTVFYQKVIFG